MFHVVNVQLTGSVKLGTPPDHLEERGSNPWRRIPSWTLWHDGWKAAKNPKFDSLLETFKNRDAMMIFFESKRIRCNWHWDDLELCTGTVLGTVGFQPFDMSSQSYRSSLGNRQRCQCLSDFALGVGIMYFAAWAIFWDFHKRTCTNPWAYQKHGRISLCLKTPFFWES